MRAWRLVGPFYASICAKHLSNLASGQPLEECLMGRTAPARFAHHPTRPSPLGATFKSGRRQRSDGCVEQEEVGVLRHNWNIIRSLKLTTCDKSNARLVVWRDAAPQQRKLELAPCRPFAKS